MTSGRSAARILSRDDVVRGAIRAIGRDGAQVTMGAIAAEVGVAKPRLYRMFTDKSDLDRAVADWLVDQIYRAVAPDLSLMMQTRRATVHQFLTAATEVVLTHPNVFRYVAITQSIPPGDGSARPLDVGRRLSGDLAERTRTLFAAVGLDTDGVDHLARGIVGFLVAVTDLWLDVPGTPDPTATQEFIERSTDSVCQLLDGFLRGKGVTVDPDQPVVETLAAISQGLPQA
ncbi:MULTISPECIES: TetR/AcrR family transcriptional regulator [Nocardia]|uniref:TetR/AcrR family transcriptional regulator n=1 Tax=Nocardia TaxID=1817 RepID=UPI001C4EB4AC|nr:MULTISPECIES: TetR/AcrR family transcriptional regulator [Nocardia]